MCDRTQPALTASSLTNMALHGVAQVSPPEPQPNASEEQKPINSGLAMVSMHPLKNGIQQI